jgi:endonuclease-3
MEKELFNIDAVMDRIRTAVKPFPPAALFQLAEEGYGSIFEQLIACILSIRTYDEVTMVVAKKVFAKARTAKAMMSLSVDELDGLIRSATFHEQKAPQILAIASVVEEKYAGQIPCDETALLSFKGVGIKCAHLVLAVACQLPYISVDVHVHRVTNRWGYVNTRTPEKTTAALETILPKEYWIEINRILVPFGKHICTGSLPVCSTCPVLQFCQQVGVQRHR